MSELDEIMDGKHEIKHLHIEGDTIAFETELNNHTWNLTPRDIEIIIYCLQKELQQKETIIKEVREYIEKLKNFKIKYVMFEEKELYASENDFVKELLEILDKGE